MTEKEVIIQVKNVCKDFSLGKTVVSALKNVSLEIYAGEYISIMGPSGSGKSTLFNMIGALDTPTGGEVTVAGVNITKLSSRELAYFRGNHIGYIFQTYNLLPAYSALFNVALPMIFSGKSVEESMARAEVVLGQVGLTHRLTHLPDELSGGQQQRVAIARALTNNPRILLADEPTGNLDLHTGEDIIKILKQLSVEHGVTVITATHDYKMLANSDRIVWVNSGQIEKIQKAGEIDIKIGSIQDTEEANKKLYQ